MEKTLQDVYKSDADAPIPPQSSCYLATLKTIESQRRIIKSQSDELERATLLLAHRDREIKFFAKKLSNTKKELKRQKEGKFWALVDSLTPELRFKR